LQFIGLVARHLVLRSEAWIARVCAVLIGVAFTWLCAAIGLCALSALTTSRPRPRSKLAKMQVVEVAQAVTQYWLDHDKCPSTKSDLVAERYINARNNLKDPWGTAIEFSCSDEKSVARSAGPDREFGTSDDITTES
jgi:hypothetical protein